MTFRMPALFRPTGMDSGFGWSPARPATFTMRPHPFRRRMREDQPGHAEVAEELELQVLQPEFLRQVVKGHSPRRAGIVHEDVNPTPGRRSRLHHAPGRGRLRQIRLDRQDPPAADGLERALRLGERFSVPRTQPDIGALSAQALGHCSADSAARSGDDRHPPRYP